MAVEPALFFAVEPDEAPLDLPELDLAALDLAVPALAELFLAALGLDELDFLAALGPDELDFLAALGPDELDFLVALDARRVLPVLLPERDALELRGFVALSWSEPLLAPAPLDDRA